MKYYEVDKAYDNFDQILDEAQEQDVMITKDGEEVAVVVGKKSLDVMRYLNGVLLEKRKIRMFKFDVITTIPNYVKLDHLHEVLKQNGREDLSVKFSKMISGSTVYVYEREPKNKIGIYPWDVAAIFYRLKVDVCFQNEEGDLVDFNKGMSGISDWI